MCAATLLAVFSLAGVESFTRANWPSSDTTESSFSISVAIFTLSSERRSALSRSTSSQSRNSATYKATAYRATPHHAARARPDRQGRCAAATDIEDVLKCTMDDRLRDIVHCLADLLRLIHL